ncbi:MULTISPECIES: dihydroneopterin aldolase [Helicobacter]|uniref:Dihydroneopterin aldolase n=1 Tax=Helicobacter colisuis TaxID=2949739 RepID=A0ABT0TVM3_9HELI|nr:MULTISPECIES: dihydroneopterin aldolase [Helicobacter]MCI7766282.1 dihydroneopterin aldolase [Helicobacter sp.]MCL9819981.1 dihydroneopterin aldolase [Helicobacter colisuis]MCL9823326.1 dihydroneopterin aldolase [Helicobacter colisuis]
MEYVIFLEDWILEVVIGILPFEREKKQKIKLEGEFYYFKNQGETFLDYRELRKFFKEAFLNEFGLLEEALEYFSKEIPKRFSQIQSYKITITKLEIFEDCKVAMQISHKIC